MTEEVTRNKMASTGQSWWPVVTARGCCAAAAAALLALALRWRRSQLSRLAPMTRVFLIRHAERQDHVFPEWAMHAARPHDSPLSEQGFDQARLTGEHLRNCIHGKELYIRSSPLVRCVQTAACLTAALHKPGWPIQIDEALCELERFLTPRMLGTHRLSVPPADRTAVAPTCDGAPRGVCRPVLFRGSHSAHTYSCAYA